MSEQSERYIKAVKQLRDEFLAAYESSSGEKLSSSAIAGMNGDLVEAYLGDLGPEYDKLSVMRGAQRGVLHVFDAVVRALRIGGAEAAHPELVDAFRTLLAQVVRGLIASQEHTIEAIEFAAQFENGEPS